MAPAPSCASTSASTFQSSQEWHEGSQPSGSDSNRAAAPRLAARSAGKEKGSWLLRKLGSPQERAATAPWQARSFEDDYQLQPDVVLGTGASGGVHEVLCRRTGRRLAVKTFQVQEIPAKMVTNLQREVQVHGSVEHPHIVRLRSVYQTPEKVNLVMDQLSGGELFDRLLRYGRFVETEAAKVAVQLLSALAYLHGRGTMHRDVKPENIMYQDSESGHIMLIDFGFASLCGLGTKLTQRCGTVQYVAPEVLTGVGYDEKADMWSVGSVLYTILTLKALYNGDEREVQKKSKNGAVDYCRTFSTLSPLAQSFLKSLLQVDPRSRSSALEALRHPWLNSLAGEAAAQARQQAPSLLARPVQRHVPLLALELLPGFRSSSSPSESEQAGSLVTECIMGSGKGGAAGERVFLGRDAQQLTSAAQLGSDLFGCFDLLYEWTRSRARDRFRAAFGTTKLP